MTHPDAARADLQTHGDPASALETVSRPLLRVVQHITGMETSFVTAIDWDTQHQDVLFSLNTGELQVAENSTTEWSDSMCRSMFLAGQAASQDVGGDVVATRNAVDTGMQSFVAVPILAGDLPIGTVCGASRRPIALSDDQVDALQCIADAMQQLLRAEQDKDRALKRATEAEQLAHTDALTGLPNRRAFVARWEDALARSGRRHHPIGVLLVDADRFKAINDTQGHLVGDEVLGAIGAALRHAARTDDIIARLGGDEFAMAVSNASGDALWAKAESIRSHFAAIAATLGVEATLSIGIAHSDHAPRHELLGHADRALYRSKSDGGDRAATWRND